MDDLVGSGDLSSLIYISSLVLPLPGIIIVVRDLGKPKITRPRFSIAHAMFLNQRSRMRPLCICTPSMCCVPTDAVRFTPQIHTTWRLIANLMFTPKVSRRRALPPPF